MTYNLYIRIGTSKRGNTSDGFNPGPGQYNPDSSIMRPKSPNWK